MSIIYYIVNVRLPTEKAHGLQIMKMCEAFLRVNLDIELVIPKRFNNIKKDPFVFYSIKSLFKINKLFCLDFIIFSKLFGRLAFWLESLSFYLAVYFWFKKKDGGKIIYLRDWPLIFFIRNQKIIYEAHNFSHKPGFLFKLAMKKIQNLVVISHGLRKEFIDFGFPKDKIIVAPDGVDLEMFNLSASQKECREKFSFPKNKKIIMYTGNFYFWKGADLLLEAVKYLPNYFFVFVGGTEKDLQKFNLVVKRDNLENILLLGYQPYHLIPYYLKSADLLVLPNRGEEKISKFYTSPMKLFEYLASGVPMVAANLPSLREILSEKNSFLFKADDLQDLIKIINFALHISSVSAKISQQALFDSHKYDWLERARLISKTF